MNGLGDMPSAGNPSGAGVRIALAGVALLALVACGNPFESGCNAVDRLVREEAEDPAFGSEEVERRTVEFEEARTRCLEEDS